MPVLAPTQESLAEKPMDSHKRDQQFSVVDALPLSLVLWLARPYLAGQTSVQAIDLAHEIYSRHKFASTIDILGEESRSDDDCEHAVAAYRQLIDGVAAKPINVSGHFSKNAQMTISIKPSMFTVVEEVGGALTAKHLDRAYERIEALVGYAKSKQINMTLEAEDHRWTDFHLDTYVSLINKGYTNLGTVLQSRLFRTRNDLRRFDERMRVRMVIGIYQEPAEIAQTQKPVMKSLLVEYSKELLARGTYVEVASHDEKCQEQFIKEAVLPLKASATQFESQFLLGVPRKELEANLTSGSYFRRMLETNNELNAADKEHLEKLSATGELVRLYLPYGENKLSAAYCKRRLKANPNMALFGIKNLLRI